MHDVKRPGGQSKRAVGIHFLFSHHGPLFGPHPHAAVASVLGVQRPHQGSDGSATDQVHWDPGLSQSSQDPHLGATSEQETQTSISTQPGPPHLLGARKWTSPGPAPSQDQTNGVAREDSSQAGEVRVTVGRLLKDPLVELQLEEKEVVGGMEEEERKEEEKKDQEEE